MSELQIARTVSIWKQIDTLAAQIESPSVTYSDDRLKMANEVIEDAQKRAALIRKLVPEDARYAG